MSTLIQFNHSLLLFKKHKTETEATWLTGEDILENGEDQVEEELQLIVLGTGQVPEDDRSTSGCICLAACLRSGLVHHFTIHDPVILYKKQMVMAMVHRHANNL